jgi:hypothetical protein
MAKRLTAKVGEYTDAQGQTKGRYTNVGVVLSNNNGEYMLLDPSVSLAGILVQQNAMAAAKGQQQRDRVMISIFDDEQRQGGNGGQQGGYGGGQGDYGQQGQGGGHYAGGGLDEDSIPFAPIK